MEKDPRLTKNWTNPQRIHSPRTQTNLSLELEASDWELVSRVGFRLYREVLLRSRLLTILKYTINKCGQDVLCTQNVGHTCNLHVSKDKKNHFPDPESMLHLRLSQPAHDHCCCQRGPQDSEEQTFGPFPFLLERKCLLRIGRFRCREMPKRTVLRV